MTINKNTGAKNNMEQDLLNDMLKEIVREDKLDTLISMMNNGLNINDFSYDNFTGLNAMIAYSLDCKNEKGGNILGYLLETATLNEIDPRNIIRMHQFLLDETDEECIEGINDEIEEFSKFISDGAKALFGLGDDEKIKPITFGSISDFIDFLKSEETSSNSKELEANKKQAKENRELRRNIAVDCGNSAVKSKADIVLKDDSSKSTSSKKIELVQPVKLKEEVVDEKKTNSFDIIGESNYKVSSISSYVTFENTSTCESESISIQADSVEDLNNKINEKISELNNQNDEKLVNSVIEMMKNNSEFKNDLLKMMKEAQIKPC